MCFSMAACAASLLALSFASSAAALPVYPGLIDNSLEVSCGTNSSRCLMCHATAAGGRNTATRDFALTLREYGFGRDTNPSVLVDLLKASASTDGSSSSAMMGGGEPSVMGASQVLAAEGLSTTDSDGDGTSDVDELLDCRNPSGDEYGVPEYGCDGGSFTGTRQPRKIHWAGAWLLGIAIFARRRRRDPPRR